MDNIRTGHSAFPTRAASFVGPNPTFDSDSHRTSSPENFSRRVTTNGVSVKQTLAVNVSSAVQAPLAAAGCSGNRPQAARPFCHAPAAAGDPPLDAVDPRHEGHRAVLAAASSVIDSSFRSLAGNTYVLPATFGGRALALRRAQRQALQACSRASSRAASSAASGDGFSAGRSLSQTRFSTACMSFTPAGDGDHRVLLGQHDAVLAERPVAAVGPVPAPPELVAVALVPVALRVAAVGRLPGGGRLDPRRGHELLALPLALLQVELAELGDVLGADAQPVAAGRDALRAGLPGRVLDARAARTGAASGSRARSAPVAFWTMAESM